jgi:hypothetical protein
MGRAPAHTRLVWGGDLANRAIPDSERTDGTDGGRRSDGWPGEGGDFLSTLDPAGPIAGATRSQPGRTDDIGRGVYSDSGNETMIGGMHREGRIWTRGLIQRNALGGDCTILGQTPSTN